MERVVIIKMEIDGRSGRCSALGIHQKNDNNDNGDDDDDDDNDKFNIKNQPIKRRTWRLDKGEEDRYEEQTKTINQ